MQSKSEKIILGHKIKRLRQDLNISQLEMAQELNISASYLNLIENNQRPITVNLLFKLGQLYNIDFKEFTEDETGKLSVELNEIFLDPVFKSSDITKRDIKNLAQQYQPEQMPGVENLVQSKFYEILEENYEKPKFF